MNGPTKISIARKILGFCSWNARKIFAGANLLMLAYVRMLDC